MKINCPHCGKEIELSAAEIAAMLGKIKSEKARSASQRNGAQSGGAPVRDFDFKPEFRAELEDGSQLDFLYKRGKHLYWTASGHDDRYKTDMTGKLLHIFRKKPSRLHH
jgi:hypothetical protein